jgi:hypothetical protein
VGAADDAAVCVEEFTGASGDVDGSAPDNQVLQNYLSLLNAVIFVVPSIWTRLDLNDKPLLTNLRVPPAPHNARRDDVAVNARTLKQGRHLLGSS